jgi:hypothetical protein
MHGIPYPEYRRSCLRTHGHVLEHVLQHAGKLVVLGGCGKLVPVVGRGIALPLAFTRPIIHGDAAPFGSVDSEESDADGAEHHEQAPEAPDRQRVIYAANPLNPALKLVQVLQVPSHWKCLRAYRQHHEYKWAINPRDTRRSTSLDRGRYAPAAAVDRATSRVFCVGGAVRGGVQRRRAGPWQSRRAGPFEATRTCEAIDFRRTRSTLSSTTTRRPRSFRLEAELPRPTCYAAAAVVGRRLLVVGGAESPFQGAEVYRDLLSLDVDDPDARWVSESARSESLKLTVPRCGHALGVRRAGHRPGAETLLCVGGYTGAMDYSATMEALRLGAGQDARGWIQGPSMRQGRSGCGAGVGPHGRLFVVGGSQDGGGRGLRSVEALDPREGFWSRMPPMVRRRRYCAATFAPDGSLYAGYGGSRSIERFDARRTTGSWEIVPTQGERWGFKIDSPAMVCLW